MISFEKEKGIDQKDLLYRFSQYRKNISSFNIPLCIFKQDRLSSLEIIVKYLRENQGLKFKDIASLLSRKEIPISTTYRNSLRKYQERLDITSNEFIPIRIFKESLRGNSTKKLSILETIVLYLKKDLDLRICDICSLLNKDHSTIWTTHKRAIDKLKEKNDGR